MADSTGLQIYQLDKAEWTRFSEDAHAAVFGKVKPTFMDRIDYAWLSVKDDKPVAYVTVRELDHETVYWQYGGAFPWALKSIWMARSYALALEKQRSLSKLVTTRVENTNLKMLRLALGHGFLINGVRMSHQSVLIELVKDLGEKNEHEADVSEHAEPSSRGEEAAAGKA